MTTNQYTFNGDGQRVQIVDSHGTKKPIWDFENILLETDGAGATQVVYTLEPAGYGNLVSQRQLGYYYDIDRLAYYLRARPYSPSLARFAVARRSKRLLRGPSGRGFSTKLVGFSRGSNRWTILRLLHFSTCHNVS